MKDKDADDGSDSDSESSDSSEDDESAFNPKFDAEFFKTLSSLKRKDPAIYEKSTKFFDVEDLNAGSATSVGSHPAKKAKALTIKQYEQDLLLKSSDALEEDSDEMDTYKRRAHSPSYNEEQKMIKNEILGKIGVIGDSDDDGEDDADDDNGIGGLFSKREQTKKEQVRLSRDTLYYF